MYIAIVYELKFTKFTHEKENNAQSQYKLSKEGGKIMDLHIRKQ